MSETAKTYTEREMVLAKREAWTNGVEFAIEYAPKNVLTFCGKPLPAEAARRYQLPARVCPRTWADQSSGLEYRVVNGAVQSKFIEHGDERWHVSPCADMFAALSDLLAHPTEEVEDDE